MAKLEIEDYSKTEQLIIDAARDVFSRKGFYGTRMHEISEQAGINKALLHYYFRNKNKLFEKVFEKVIKELLDKLFSIEVKPDALEETIYTFSNNYIDFFQANQLFLNLLFKKSVINPDWIIALFKKQNITETKFFQTTFNTIQRMKQTDKSVIDSIINIVFTSDIPDYRQTSHSGNLNINDEDYNKLIEARKQTVPKLILNSLKTKEQ